MLGPVNAVVKLKRTAFCSYAFLNVGQKLLDLETKAITEDCEKTNSVRINVKIDKMFKMIENDIEVTNFHSFIHSFFFFILLTVHLKIFILLLTNLMH